MSQWGQELTIGKESFLPHVATKIFEPLSPQSLVDMIVMSGGGKDFPTNALKDLEQKYIGKPYGDWLRHAGKGLNNQQEAA